MLLLCDNRGQALRLADLALTHAELVAEVARIFHALPEEEREVACIFAGNYGEAGAVNLFDEDPPTASGFNGFESTIHDPRGRLWYFRLRYTL